MLQSEKFKDWQFRYQYIYAKRQSDKSKNKFIGALLTDLFDLGVTPTIIEFDRQKNRASRNIYIGDLSHSKRVICTYYDTPQKFFGDYVLFDRDTQSRRTILYLIVTSVILLLIGFFSLLYLINNQFLVFNFQNPRAYLGFLVILIFFVVLGRVSKGLPNRQNLIRNTSTLLLMLSMIEKNNDEQTAFAFIDEGSLGEQGLKVLQSSVSKNTLIFFLDSIGANTALNFKGEKSEKFSDNSIKNASGLTVNYIFSGEKKDNQFYLSKKILKNKKINMKNLDGVMKAFSFT